VPRDVIEREIYLSLDEIESNAVDVLIHGIRRKFDRRSSAMYAARGWLVIKDASDVHTLDGAGLIAAVLTAVGLVGVLVAYFAGKDEANLFFDVINSARASAMSVRSTASLASLPPSTSMSVPYSVSKNGCFLLIRTTGGVDIPRQGTNGFVDLTVNGVAWRVFTTRAGGRTVQVSHRQEVRDDVAEQLAMSAALPILAAIPIAWVIIVLAMGRLFKRLDQASIGIARRSINSTEPLPLNVAG
jgi:two-component system OmpR family sensor kinase